MAKRATLKDLLNAGLLRVGEVLECEPRQGQGEVYKTTLREDATISYEGISFDSPSPWAKYVAQNERNGWQDVRARGRRLAEFRAQLGRGVATRPSSVGTGTALPPRVEVRLPDLETPQKEADHQLLARLQSLTSTKFEQLVARFLEAKGLAKVLVTGRTGDGGIDGEGAILFLKLRVAFQAKRYASDNAVGAPPIRNFKGGLVGRYDRGIFITTSTFTPGAKEEADQPGIVLVLIDGNELVTEMVEMGLGMRTIPVVETQIDEEFFKNLGV